MTDLSTLLLERMSSPEGRTFDMQELLGQLGEGDPRMGLVAKVLAQREAERQQEEDASTQAEQSKVEQRSEALRRLQQTMQKLYAELETLRERNDMLAAALGACHLCWGDDPLCPECAGAGLPGSYQPDIALFRELIAPALRRKGALINGKGHFKRNGKAKRPGNGQSDLPNQPN